MDIRNYDSRDGHGFLSVKAAGRLLYRNGFSLGPRAIASFLIEGFDRAGEVEIILDGSDDLAIDNYARGWLRALTPMRVQLVSSSTELIEELSQVAAATPGIELSSLPISEFRNDSAESFDVHIFDAVAPPSSFGANAL